MSSARSREDAAHETGVTRQPAFAEDPARNIMGEPPARGPDERPVEQKWATGAGRVIGLASGVLGILVGPFVGMLGAALGFLGLVLGSTARGHMAPGRPGRWVATAASVLGIAGIVVGIASVAIGIVISLR